MKKITITDTTIDKAAIYLGNKNCDTYEKRYAIVEKALLSQKQEITKTIGKIPETKPEYESDLYDEGLKDMKGTILSVIEGVH